MTVQLNSMQKAQAQLAFIEQEEKVKSLIDKIATIKSNLTNEQARYNQYFKDIERAPPGFYGKNPNSFAQGEMTRIRMENNIR